MTLFWILVAMMILATLILLAPSILKRRKLAEDFTQELNVSIARERLKEIAAEYKNGGLSDEEYEQAKKDLEVALAQDIGSEASTTAASKSPLSGIPFISVVAVFLSILTVLLYDRIGSPDYMDIAGPGQAQNTPHSGTTEKLPSIEEMVTQLEERMLENPDDPDGWYLLGRTYMKMGRHAEAVPVFEKVRGLVGDDPTVLLSLADAMAMSKGGSLAGKPTELVHQVLEVQPMNVTALWLAGSSAYESGEFEQAVIFWRRAEPQLDPQMQMEIRSLIADAEKELGRPVETGDQLPTIEQPAIARVETSTETTSGTAAAANAAVVTVTATLDPAITESVSPEDTVFIFAKAVSGPPMPLAVVRKKVKDLPVRVRLDDSQAMMPAMAISKFDEVNVGARVSKTGNAIAQSGDFSSELVKVATNGEGEASVTISTQVP